MVKYETIINHNREWKKPFPPQQRQPKDVPRNHSSFIDHVTYYCEVRIQFNDTMRATYDPGLDVINLPRYKHYLIKPEWINTFFHELTHWTGHENRLNRDYGWHPVCDEYMVEELTAELGSMMLCKLRIGKTFDNSKAYLKSWIDTGNTGKVQYHQALRQAIHAYEYLTGFVITGLVDIFNKKDSKEVLSEAQAIIQQLEAEFASDGTHYQPYCPFEQTPEYHHIHGN